MSERSYRLFVRTPLWLAVGALVVMGIFSRRGLVDYRRMVERNSELTHRIEEVHQQRAAIVQQVETIRQSRDEQERWVRSVLGFVKKGETVIEFD